MNNHSSTTGQAKINILAVSTYELGHQPLILARLASTFDHYGVSYTLIDNSVDNRSFETPNDFRLSNGSFPTHLIISVPMHTATQLGKKIAERARTIFASNITVISLGMYFKVALSAPGLFDCGFPTFDSPGLLGTLGLDDSPSPKMNSLVPNRTSLPLIANYARLITQNDQRPVGYVESTTGCAHECRHCPVPVVHHGKFKAIARQIVLDEIDNLVENGAQHITFGDPDFLNGPTHAVKIVREMHRRHPGLTFDATIKVEHVLEHPSIWDEMAQCGLLFIVSAFEHTSEIILEKLDKGHTKSDIIEALILLRTCGIEVRPSLLPFTPWTNQNNFIELVEFIFEHDLTENIDPVQLGIRLLVPLDSLLLSDEDIEFGPWNPDALSFEWRSNDPKVDQLQEILSEIAQTSQTTPESPTSIFHKMRDATYDHFGVKRPPLSSITIGNNFKPRLSESWFCCAEPTQKQLGTFELCSGPQIEIQK